MAGGGLICANTSYEPPWVTHGNCRRQEFASRNSVSCRNTCGGGGSLLAAGGPFTSAASDCHERSGAERSRSSGKVCDDGQ